MQGRHSPKKNGEVRQSENEGDGERCIMVAG